MAISPFSTPPPTARQGESRRARLAAMIAAVGIGATLLAYAADPGVRHAVVHAEHSVKHAVSNMFDRDTNEHRARKPTKRPAASSQGHARLPLRPGPAAGASTRPGQARRSGAAGGGG